MSRKKRILILGLIGAFCMTACGTTELEERCFPQLVAVGYEDGQVTFCAGFPKMQGATTQEPQSNEIKVPLVSSNSFEESQRKYEGHLNKLTDYNHLKVLVLEEDLMEEKKAYEDMLEYLAKQEEMPRNTYVCGVDDVEELMEIDSKLPQDIGIYLEEFLTNHEKKKNRLLTLGDLLDEKENKQMVLYLPYLEVEDNYVEWAGYYAIGQGERPIEID